VSLSRLLTARGGPTRLVLVRHGESEGNLADREARERGADRLELSVRDADIDLSPTGRRQADAVGRWLAEADPSQRPDLVVSSPYRRAVETARRALGDLDVPLLLDERLRERDLGAFDGLTGAGIRAEFPDEAARRAKVGKFYYQPPSGESWSDVALRVRSFVADLREVDAATVWCFAHQAVIMSFRYVLEGLDEQELLRIDRENRLGNASMTRYRRSDAGLELEVFADTEAVDRAAADTTHEHPQAGRGDEHHGGRREDDREGDRQPEVAGRG
jgi:broad specificity phosphatase PhoE